MAVVKAQNFTPIRHQFRRMRSLSARSSASVKHQLPRLRCEEISAQNGRLVLDRKPTVSITLELVKCDMRPDADPVGSIVAWLCLTAVGRQRG